MNYFSGDELAERYARSRPYFHPVVVAHIWERLKIEAPLPVALDVGSGTGHSALALQAMADQVVGIDGARAMVEAAPKEPALQSLVGEAESLPFRSGSFPLITVSRAFHWFDRNRFLPEARRVLMPDGWLILYGNRFVSATHPDPLFARWMDDFRARFAGPQRDYTPMTPADSARYGFRLVERQPYTNEWTFAHLDLVEYLMTMSAVTQAIETGTESEESIRTWFAETLARFFTAGPVSFEFSGTIEYLQRSNEEKHPTQ